MSLAKQLGRDYLDQFYKGAYFQMGNKIYIYSGHINPDTIGCYSIQVDGVRKFEGDHIPSASIQSMDTFAWPNLGYREVTLPRINKKGVFMASSVRSAMRGLQDRHLNMQFPSYVGLFNVPTDVRQMLPKEQYIRQIFNPTYTSFREGMRQLKAGEALAFALNNKLSVGISVNQGPNRLYDVLYKGTVLGEVNERDEVILPYKLAKRASTISLFEGSLRV